MINLTDIFDNSILWQMSIAERLALYCLFNKMSRRKVAIEIGSYFGGSLRMITANFKKVYSLDTDHSKIDTTSRQFKNVEFITGDSKFTLPELVLKINTSWDSVDFVLVDADHEFEAVRRDLANVLKIKPKRDMTIILHDSWHTPTREAIHHTDWNACPYVEYIEKDFVPGDLTNGKLWGGFALVCLSPKMQTIRPLIRQTHDLAYRTFTKSLEEQARP